MPKCHPGCLFLCTNGAYMHSDATIALPRQQAGAAEQSPPLPARRRHNGPGGGAGASAKQAPVPGSAPDLDSASAAQQAQLSLGDSQQVFGRPSGWASKADEPDDADDADLEAGAANLGGSRRPSAAVNARSRSPAVPCRCSQLNIGRRQREILTGGA